MTKVLVTGREEELETDEAAGKRFFVTAGYCSNAEMGKIVWDNFPELREKLPDPDNMGGAPNPRLQTFGYDTSRAKSILGMTFTPYEKTVVDSVKSLQGLQE
ncbi:ketoreductase [Colletotrichum sojae]|uniref:Ketoreductase n=1 Tax=Colletotrichum sojae TaxID=2175907 RepID=A0A8H6MUB7_9PEZI|nr:ketoreductase [Colletotrichum sojae]